MSGRQGPAADGGAVDADGQASLLPGLELFVHSLLFGDDGSQGVNHLLELLLVRVVELVHPLGERPVYDVIAAGVPCGCLIYHGDDFVGKASRAETVFRLAFLLYSFVEDTFTQERGSEKGYFAVLSVLLFRFYILVLDLHHRIDILSTQ